MVAKKKSRARSESGKGKAAPRTSRKSGKAPAPTYAKSVSTGYVHFAQVDPRKLVRRKNIRTEKVSRAEFAGMVASIKERIARGDPGLREAPRATFDGKRYHLDSGNTRTDAAIAAGVKLIEVCFRKAHAGESLEVRDAEAIESNLRRKNLGPYELAEALVDFAKKYSTPKLKIGPIQLAKRFGEDRRTVANLVRIRTKIHPEVWKEIVRGKAPQHLAFIIAKCKTLAEQRAIWNRYATQRAAADGTSRKSSPERAKALRTSRKSSPAAIAVDTTPERCPHCGEALSKAA